MNPLIIVDNPDRWPFDIPNVEVVSARTYLTQPTYSVPRQRRIFNLCRSYRYQSTGYYVSLLAEARGQRPMPSMETIQDLKSQAIMRVASEELEELMQKSLSSLTSDKFSLSIYFGRNMAKRYERLSKHLYNLFPAPMLRAEFVHQPEDGWQLQNVDPISTNEVPPSHRPFLVEAANHYFAGKTARAKKKQVPRYSLAILRDPDEKNPPSNEKAIQRFIRAGESLGLEVDEITRDDAGNLGEYDALFIRVTTAVNHYTYRLARKAKANHLVVIDDPDSIIKCSNKVFLQELLLRNKIPTPRTIILHKDNIAEAPEQLGFPIILKQPDSSFSQGVVKVDTAEDYAAKVEDLLQKSDLIVAQEFLYTPFDWRIGILDEKPIYACKYYMARKHWQIYNHGNKGQAVGNSETLPVELAPRHVIRTALKAANLIGNGLYGVDIKEVGGKSYVIEVNDNPSIDAGVEDTILRENLYLRVMESFLRRLEDQ